MKIQTLEEQIQIFNADLPNQLPADVLQNFQRSIHELQSQNMLAHALDLGQKLPNFHLSNTNNQSVSLSELLEKNKFLAVCFYRGSWCPYCNMELNALQKILPQLKLLDTNVVAISPQLNQFAVDLKYKNQLDFTLLHDKDNTYAKQIGISFSLQDFIVPTYVQIGIDLKSFNANTDNTLPAPAVFIVNNEGTIIYRFMDINYMNRVNLEGMIEFISSQTIDT